MNETRVLLQAYYEVLYERLEARRPLLTAKVDELLAAEVDAQGYEDFNGEKYAAYKDACLAFVDERIEAYNPVGLQYLFDREVAKDAFPRPPRPQQCHGARQDVKVIGETP